MSLSIKDKIIKKIKSFKPDYVFIANDFLDIAEYQTVRVTLNRLVDSGYIERILKGFYYKPKYIEIIGEYKKPNVNEVAKAIARKYNWTIAPSGNTALNMLGLDTQVPSKWTYISNGVYKKVNVFNSVIEFKHRRMSEISNISEITSMVIQAFKVLGKEHVKDYHINHLIRILSNEQKKQLIIEAKSSSKWIYEIITKICEETDV